MSSPSKTNGFRDSGPRLFPPDVSPRCFWYRMVDGGPVGPKTRYTSGVNELRWFRGLLIPQWPIYFWPFVGAPSLHLEVRGPPCRIGGVFRTNPNARNWNGLLPWKLHGWNMKKDPKGKGEIATQTPKLGFHVSFQERKLHNKNLLNKSSRRWSFKKSWPLDSSHWNINPTIFQRYLQKMEKIMGSQRFWKVFHLDVFSKRGKMLGLEFGVLLGCSIGRKLGSMVRIHGFCNLLKDGVFVGGYSPCTNHWS